MELCIRPRRYSDEEMPKPCSVSQFSVQWTDGTIFHQSEESLNASMLHISWGGKNSADEKIETSKILRNSYRAGKEASSKETEGNVIKVCQYMTIFQKDFIQGTSIVEHANNLGTLRIRGERSTGSRGKRNTRSRGSKDTSHS